MNIGDKYLKMKNTEDLCSLKIFIVEDVYEISSTENVYELNILKVKYRGKITQFQN